MLAKLLVLSHIWYSLLSRHMFAKVGVAKVVNEVLNQTIGMLPLLLK